MTMARAAVIRQHGAKFRVEDISVKPPSDNEVQVAIVSSGMCHTDLLVRDGFGRVPTPVVLGHEGYGVVEVTGDAVTSVSVGDRVVLGFPHCGRCGRCLSGRPYICDEFNERWHRCARVDGSSPFQGSDGRLVHGFFAGQSSFSSRTIVDARQVVPVNVEVDPALLAPLACGVSTGAGAVVNRLRPKVGSSVVIIGLGAVGLSALMAAVRAGCAQVVGVDTVDDRLDLATRLGATAVFDARSGSYVAELRKIVRGGVDFAVEAAGHPDAVAAAVAALAPGGRAVFLGNFKEGVRFELPPQLLEWSQSLGGSNLGDTVPLEFVPMLAEHVATGRLPVGELVVPYALEEVEQAAQDLLEGRVVKPVLMMS